MKKYQVGVIGTLVVASSGTGRAVLGAVTAIVVWKDSKLNSTDEQV